jgi:hypothetical protein
VTEVSTLFIAPAEAAPIDEEMRARLSPGAAVLRLHPIQARERAGGER